jgi:hypothetical protein
VPMEVEVFGNSLPPSDIAGYTIIESSITSV